MIMKTEKQEINIVIRTRKIAKLTDKLKGNNLNDMFFKGLRDCSPTTLGIFIEAFAEKEDGKPAFGSVLDAYDFIDDYRVATNQTYADIYKELAVAINDMGFFNKKMTEKELKEKIEDQVGEINISEIVQSAVEKEAGTIVHQEFNGYKA